MDGYIRMVENEKEKMGYSTGDYWWGSVIMCYRRGHAIDCFHRKGNGHKCGQMLGSQWRLYVGD